MSELLSLASLMSWFRAYEECATQQFRIMPMLLQLSFHVIRFYKLNLTRP